jgi:hypothetical protein
MRVMAVMVTTDPRPLGPFQGLWQAWDETPDVKLEKDIGHLRHALEVQVDELEAQLYAGNSHAAAAEALGCVSAVLNLLCRMGYTPHQIAEIARHRR